jgi:GNAT superfamily N-acetyltransferase
MAENGIKIRSFGPSDLKVVKELVDKTMEVNYRGFFCEEVMEYFNRFHGDVNVLQVAILGQTIVAEKDGRILGTGSIIDDYILRVYIDPAYQRQGVGRLVMAALEQWAASRGKKKVRLRATDISRSYYEKIGYTVMEKNLEETENGKELVYYLMEKDVGQKDSVSAGRAAN